MESVDGSGARSPLTIFCFVTLAVIRGTFAIAIHYGISAYGGVGLLFLLRTPGTVVLFLISMIYIASKEEEAKLEILNDLKGARSYKRAAILGFIQLCGPYLLFMYAMKYLSPTLGGIFMAATPWMTVLLEQVLALTTQTVRGTDWNIVGSLVGVGGIVFASIADISSVVLDTSCEAIYENVTQNISQTSLNGSTLYQLTNVTRTVQKDTCETTVQITTAFLALCGATLLWSLSKVFSRLRRISLHFLTGGCLNNVFAGLYAGILWLVVEQHFNNNTVIWNRFSGAISVVFLTLASSWVAGIILYKLFRKIGADSTNRVMCLVPLITWAEDQLFIKHNQHLWMIIVEAIGLLLVVSGLYISSFRKQQQQNPMREGLLNEYHSSGDDEEIQHHVSQLTESVQSDDNLEVSGTSSMVDSVEPPMIHYVDDNADDEF